MPVALTIGRAAGYTAASLTLRLIVGALDLAIEAGIAAAISLAWLQGSGLPLPPRYWNAFDYLVDVAGTVPEAIAIPALIFAGVFLVWETAFGSLLGAAPVARLAGMRLVTTSGRKPGVVRVGLRAALALPLALAAGIGPATALASPRRRMLHDILAGCLVLRGDVPDGWGRRQDADSDAGLSPGPRSYLDVPRR
ncbi:MAG: RDD family protein [Deltaproteobacteria bacterium]|nr:RDD family protein [Deltaproteobacteria bacterium]